MKKKLGALMLLLSAILIILFAANALEIVDTGTCKAESDGGNHIQAFDSEGTLTISGLREMANYKCDSKTPRQFNNTSIKNVVIERGVTSIDNEAFFRCQNLIAAIIPNSITSICNMEVSFAPLN